MFGNIFSFLCDMTIPVILILTGIIFGKYPVKNINSAFGYRTRRSMASQEAWDYANSRFAKIYLIAGIILTAVFLGDKTVAVLLETDIEKILTFNVIIGIAACLLPIPIIEKELKVLTQNSIEKEKPQ